MIVVGMKMNPPERAKILQPRQKHFVNIYQCTGSALAEVLSVAEGGSKGAVHVRVTVVELDVVTHG